MLFVKQVAPKGGKMDGIFIYDYRDEDDPHTVYAQRGQLSYDPSQESIIMDLFEGRVFHWDKEPNRWQTVEFKSYQVPLQMFGVGAKGVKSEQEMSLGELRAILAENPLGSDKYDRAVVEMNQRFALPVGALLLCLMAMPLGYTRAVTARAWGLIMGLVVFLVYYIIFTASWRLAITAQGRPVAGPLDLRYSVYLGGPFSLVLGPSGNCPWCPVTGAF